MAKHPLKIAENMFKKSINESLRGFNTATKEAKEALESLESENFISKNVEIKDSSLKNEAIKPKNIQNSSERKIKYKKKQDKKQRGRDKKEGNERESIYNDWYQQQAALEKEALEKEAQKETAINNFLDDYIETPKPERWLTVQEHLKEKGKSKKDTSIPSVKAPSDAKPGETTSNASSVKASSDISNLPFTKEEADQTVAAGLQGKDKELDAHGRATFRNFQQYWKAVEKKPTEEGLEALQKMIDDPDLIEPGVMDYVATNPNAVKGVAGGAGLIALTNFLMSDRKGQMTNEELYSQ